MLRYVRRVTTGALAPAVTRSASVAAAQARRAASALTSPRGWVAQRGTHAPHAAATPLSSDTPGSPALLAVLEPKSVSPRAPVTARANTDRFAPVSTKRIRFTIQATRKLEPCLDELEVFNSAGENVALGSRGTTVTTSGDTTVTLRLLRRATLVSLESLYGSFFLTVIMIFFFAEGLTSFSSP